MLQRAAYQHKLSLLNHVGGRIHPKTRPSSMVPPVTLQARPAVSTSPTECEPTPVKAFEEMPGPRSLPFVGTLYKYLPMGEYNLQQPHASDMKRYKKYGPIVREELFPGVRQVRLFDPDDIAALFRNEGPNPVRFELQGLKAYRDSKGWSRGLLSTNGEDWQKLRSQVQRKMLNRINAASYIPAQAQITEDFAESIRVLRDENGEIHDFLSEIYKWAMESIAVVCFDNRIGVLDMNQPPDSEANVFIKAVGRALDGIYRTTVLWEYYKRRPNSPTMRNLYHDLDTIFNIASENMTKALDRAARGEESLIPRENSLLLRLMAKPQTSQLEATSMMIDFLFGGIDNPSHTLAFNLYNLTLNPTCQRRLQQEIDEFAPRGTTMSFDLFEKMPYLRAVTKETSRLIPTAQGTMRILDKDIILSGYRIPAGTMIICGNTVICRLPQYYDSPDVFWPERWVRQSDGSFTNDTSPAAKRFSLLPFGHGPRMCIGRRFAEQEVWLGLIKILQRFTVEYHHDPIGHVTKMVTTPDRPLRFTFVDRH